MTAATKHLKKTVETEKRLDLIAPVIKLEPACTCDKL